MKLGILTAVLVGLLSATRLAAGQTADMAHEPVSGHQQDLVNPPLDYNVYNPAYGAWPHGGPWYSSAALSAMQANTCCVGLWDGYCGEPHYLGKCSGRCLDGQGLFCGGCPGTRRFLGLGTRSCVWRCRRGSGRQVDDCPMVGCPSCGEAAGVVELPEEAQPMPPEQPAYDAKQPSPYRSLSHEQATLSPVSSRRNRSSR